MKSVSSIQAAPNPSPAAAVAVTTSLLSMCFYVVRRAPVQRHASVQAVLVNARGVVQERSKMLSFWADHFLVFVYIPASYG
jgi:hypothetical protein